jgi:DNA repair exonuclease SbcCD ATPase subunit
MNPTNSQFPNAQPALKLTRRAPTAAGLTATPFSTGAQREIAADLAALEEREANLREYEARLRAWQEQLDAASGQPASAVTNAPFLRPSSQTPFQSDAALSAAWEKFHRAQALFEAEQNQVRDDRMALRDAEANLRRREEALEAREARLKERELLLTTAVGAEAKPEEEAKKPVSAMQRLTQAPWAVFKSGK